MLMNQTFKNMLKYKSCLHLQIIKTVYPIYLRYSKYNFRLKYFLSLWSLNQLWYGALFVRFISEGSDRVTTGLLSLVGSLPQMRRENF